MDRHDMNACIDATERAMEEAGQEITEGLVEDVIHALEAAGYTVTKD